jgi:hypothetical protein
MWVMHCPEGEGHGVFQTKPRIDRAPDVLSHKCHPEGTVPRIDRAVPGQPSYRHMPAAPCIAEGRVMDTPTGGGITIVCLWEGRGAVR